MRGIAILIAIFALFGRLAAAPEGRIIIKEAWVQVSPIPGRPAAAYLVIENNQDVIDYLVAAASPAAEKLTLHQSLLAQGVMRMRRIDSLEVPANGRFVLRPGEHHLMLLNTIDDLASRRSVLLRLCFKRAGWIEATAAVRKFGSRRKPE